MSVYLSTVTENDYEALDQLIYTSSERADRNGDNEVKRIIELRQLPEYRYELELAVKTKDGDIIGYGMLIEAQIEGASKTYSALAIGALIVAQDFRDKGVGAAIVNALEERAREAMYNTILSVGYASYYETLGYESGIAHDIKPPKEVDAAAFGVKFLWESLSTYPEGQAVFPDVFFK
ncbi:GNAT family N-acetyltransferase [Staphylococcus massiliensis]|uniref:GNAT family acetyltransferase n=1 Tax=Staphylococcus massiliensis S46 TaxID=1229783 RepID=K9ALJ1_9STAP|nr:N-acetyltransferase [Staphylococcus massiliensis]EKU48243.1 GNAT family acetyltransferase [Staphylococcus massiliensis S46]MCG3399496.1 N-acetyltransferase [Staphylococcus massiliensis]MCG3402006.1 N-acetyltransferase [Staphylococcus massiliensis]MCG3412765.1 N-acetyltransferase [Staphylococcus massiliensis]POA00255.1 N-acetyltransferase [Staphylococcus massiliensis CCUG 55927]